MYNGFQRNRDYRAAEAAYFERERLRQSAYWASAEGQECQGRMKACCSALCYPCKPNCDTVKDPRIVVTGVLGAIGCVLGIVGVQTPFSGCASCLLCTLGGCVTVAVRRSCCGNKDEEDESAKDEDESAKKDKDESAITQQPAASVNVIKQ